MSVKRWDQRPPKVSSWTAPSEWSWSKSLWVDVFISVGIFLHVEFLDHRIHIWASSECPAKKLSRVPDANLYSDEPWMRASSTLCCYCLLAKVVSDFDSMDWTTPGFPALPYFPEFLQIYVHWVGDAIQPSHPLLSPSPALNLSQHQGLFWWVSSSHDVFFYVLSTRYYGTLWFCSFICCLVIYKLVVFLFPLA